MQFSYLMTNDGDLTISIDGRGHSVPTDHANYSLIVEAINDQQYDGIEDLINIKQAIVDNFADQSCRVTVSESGEVCFNGKPLHNAVTRRIVAYMQRGLDFKPLVRFLDRLMNNPSWNSVEQLFDFIDNEDMPITPDGCFIAYKGVQDDWMDAHSGTIDNSIGQIVEMPRNQVCDDASVGCASGLHAGSLQYARGHASRTILVKIDPADCVSVPRNECDKLRCCRYEVVSEYVEPRALEAPLYQGSQTPDKDDTNTLARLEDEMEDDSCPECGHDEWSCWCEEEEEGNDYYDDTPF